MWTGVTLDSIICDPSGLALPSQLVLIRMWLFFVLSPRYRRVVVSYPCEMPLHLIWHCSETGGYWSLSVRARWPLEARRMGIPRFNFGPCFLFLLSLSVTGAAALILRFPCAWSNWRSSQVQPFFNACRMVILIYISRSAPMIYFRCFFRVALKPCGDNVLGAGSFSVDVLDIQMRDCAITS